MDGRDGALFGAERAATRWTGPAQRSRLRAPTNSTTGHRGGCSRGPGNETTAAAQHQQHHPPTSQSAPPKKASNRKNETSDPSAINHCGAISLGLSALAWGNKGPLRPLTVHHPKGPETRGIMQALRPGWGDMAGVGAPLD